MFRNKFLVSIVQLHFLKHFYFLIKKTPVATLCEKEVSKDPRFILYIHKCPPLGKLGLTGKVLSKKLINIFW